ncbi:MAG: Uncharacterised protein [Flavobacterium sp. SCGC AAA160-P02]|nr:MAG: Uncharacterised protein [Flavobacterium sp. SCGC AAA160-P02]
MIFAVVPKRFIMSQIASSVNAVGILNILDALPIFSDIADGPTVFLLIAAKACLPGWFICGQRCTPVPSTDLAHSFNNSKYL